MADPSLLQLGCNPALQRDSKNVWWDPVEWGRHSGGVIPLSFPLLPVLSDGAGSQALLTASASPLRPPP